MVSKEVSRVFGFKDITGVFYDDVFRGHFNCVSGCFKGAI